MGCSFDCKGNLSIGKNSVINSKCRIDNRAGVSIGENVSISNDVIILTADHDMNIDMNSRLRKVVIEDYVWIGTRAMILPGVTIERGAVVAAGAVVTKSIAAFKVTAGVPARVIKERSQKDDFKYNSSYKRYLQ